MQTDKTREEKIDWLLENAPSHIGHTLNIEFISFGKDELKASMPVDENTVQPFGILHGGASAVLAESLASVGAWLNIDDPSKAAVGVEINANHLRIVKRGNTVFGKSMPVRRGKKIQVWETKITDDPGNLVCVSRCTLAVIDRRKPR